MQARAMQALHLLALDPVAETTADPCSDGFRTQRSTADAIGSCFRVLARKTAPPWILEGDIEACFEGISHQWLLAPVTMDKRLLQGRLQAGIMEEGKYASSPSGTPQGGILSPVLEHVKGNKVNLIRSADDCVPRV